MRKRVRASGSWTVANVIVESKQYAPGIHSLLSLSLAYLVYIVYLDSTVRLLF